MRIYLVRHGQTEFNQGSLALGQRDVDLNETGETQIERVRERFQGEKVTKILSSDLLRCRKTAQKIVEATGAPVEFTAALRERSFGEWEGQDYADVSDRLHKMSVENCTSLHNARPPGGESHADIWARVAPVLEPLTKADGTYVVVSHGGTCRVLLSVLVRATLETTFCFKFDNASVTRLDRRADGAMLLNDYNDTSHLQGLVTGEAIPGAKK